MSVAATLAGDTLVVETTVELDEARKVLAAYSHGSQLVWIVNQETVDVLAAFELTPDEIGELTSECANEEEFGRVLDADYVRYNGSLYPLSDFNADWGITRRVGLPEWMQGWHAYLSDSFSSGLVLRYHKQYDDDHEPDLTGDSGVTIARYIVG
ncbi:hypothetical protein ACFOOK_26460 [Micromonospora krabiensis]|uniref:Uncharacterized protein n=1 Tax=Micromonospora krabiensis TaxID=307121 RepID=A0A1C3N5L6_9ACTN|nr:hypothetical protein [Micromonospora krabiensis]SBV27889.1 hypothetical protein GA0070620_3420 [Micromonospora krabiensis]